VLGAEPPELLLQSPSLGSGALSISNETVDAHAAQYCGKSRAAHLSRIKRTRAVPKSLWKTSAHRRKSAMVENAKRHQRWAGMTGGVLPPSDIGGMSRAATGAKVALAGALIGGRKSMACDSNH
jgi:hypothetical protein